MFSVAEWEALLRAIAFTDLEREELRKENGDLPKRVVNRIEYITRLYFYVFKKEPKWVVNFHFKKFYGVTPVGGEGALEYVPEYFLSKPDRIVWDGVFSRFSQFWRHHDKASLEEWENLCLKNSKLLTEYKSNANMEEADKQVKP